MRAPRIMVLGDSLASGMQDDYTWRWRLAQYIWRTGMPAEFVGPHTGTFSMYDDPVLLALAEGRDLPTGPDAVNPMTGAYRAGPFPSGHCAQPGWTAHAAKHSVREQVAAERPDFLLVQLGFNDLAVVGPPQQTLRDLAEIIAEARAAQPAVTILVADIAGASDWGNEWFHRAVDDYNARLPAELAAQSTDRSPVVLVDVHTAFDPAHDTYDGIHPNPVGELAMAGAFADALRDFGIGSGPLLPPPLPPRELPLAEPEITAAQVSSTDIDVGWGRVRGASAYRIGLRDVTLDLPRAQGPIPVLGDHWRAQDLIRDHVYEFDVTAVRGRRLGPRSQPLRVSLRAAAAPRGR